MVTLEESDFVQLRISKSADDVKIADRVARQEGSNVSSLEVFAVLGYLHAKGLITNRSLTSVTFLNIALDIFDSHSNGSIENNINKVKYIIDSLLKYDYLTQKPALRRTNRKLTYGGK